MTGYYGGSAIEWPEDRPYREEADDGPKQLSAMGVIEQAARAYELAPLTESPIETILGAELALLMVHLAPLKFDIWRGETQEFEVPTLLLVPQYQLAGFRFDFALKLSDQLKPRLLVECDGKDFHSSPEQKANDEKKNECAAAHGIKLMRFSGREINRQPGNCARAILATLIWKKS